MRESTTNKIQAMDMSDAPDIKDKIYFLLRKMIMKREFTPNERLDAYEIAKKLSVSRTPVRDALNMLDAEGFIQTLPSKGTFVTGIYREDLIQIFQYREMIELYTLEMGFPALVQSFSAFKGIMDNWDREMANADYDGSVIMDSDVQIHKLIVQSAGNARILRSYESLNCHVQTARGYYLQNLERINASQAEHKLIVAAVEQQDRDRARLMLKHHLNQTLDSLLQMIDIFKVF